MAGTRSDGGDTMDILAYLMGKKAGGGGSSVTVEALTATENKVYTAPSGKAYSPVTVNVSQGGGSVAASDVNFYDYDGIIVYSYSASDFANLSALPANPSHEGLTAQGWNWTLADAKTYVAAYGMLNIGQMYITTDGKTRVYIHLEEGRTSPMLGVCPAGTVDVDWGDGTTHDTLTGTSTSEVQWTPNHTYAAPGDYVIKLTVTGSMGFYGNSSYNQYCGLLRYSSSGDTRNAVYQNAIQALFIGSGVTSIGSCAFKYCHSLSIITLPSSVTSIGSDAFHSCNNLSSIVLPSGVTSIGEYAFGNCARLSSITIPSSVTSIGGYVFYACYSLSSITIPSGVTNIDSFTFNNCYDLLSVSIPSSVTSINNSAFYGCANLSSIVLPNGVTNILNSVFQYCSSLFSIVLPSSIKIIGDNTFQYCSGLSSITVPTSVTSIGSNTYNGCSGLSEIHFNPTNPPSVYNSNAFSGIPTDCKIYVPTGRLSAYTSANNYPSSSTYTYVEE